MCICSILGQYILSEFGKNIMFPNALYTLPKINHDGRAPAWTGSNVWRTKTSSAFNSDLHTLFHTVFIIFLITCPYYRSLPLLMTVVIGSSPTNFLNYSLVLMSFMETTHIHLMIVIAAPSNINKKSASKGLVSLP